MIAGRSTRHTGDVTDDQPDPAAVLRRIAYLLERAREETYRVRAYRTAAATAGTAGLEDLRRRHAAGTLTDLPGIGKKTASIIADVLDGRTPDYLAGLEETADGPVTSGGATMRQALRGDLHTHSDWSDGGSPITDMVQAARDLGHEYIALTDHSPRLTVANGLSAERLHRQLDVIDDINAQADAEAWGIRILTGIEVDILDDGRLDQTPELLDRLDVVVASVHSKLRMGSDDMTKRMVTAIANPRVDVLGHCTGRLITGGRGTRPESTFDADIVFAACARFDVAVEINSRPERLDPPMRLLHDAVAAGCRFSIDTDAHAPGQLEWQPYGCERAEDASVPPERGVNTWPVTDLLAWTGTAPAK